MAPSAVWAYFKKFANNTKVKCEKCGKEMNFNNSTTTLANHLKTAHKIIIEKQTPTNCKRIRLSSVDENTSPLSPQSLVNKEVTVSTATSSRVQSDLNQEVLDIASSSSSSPITSPGPLDKCINNVFSFSAGGHKDISVTNALIFMIAKDDLPLRTPERTGFRHFVKKLQPLYKVPSEPTLTKRLENKYYDLREQFSNFLSQSPSICLTADIWTHTSTMKSYLGVTAHFLVGTEMQSIDLCAKLLTNRKTIVNLRCAFREVCQEWKISYDSIVAVLTDGGANIAGAAQEEFGVSKHISCLAHKINNIGQACIGLHDNKLPSEVEDFSEVPDNEEDLDEGFDDHQLGDLIERNHNNLMKQLILKVKRIVRFFRKSEIATSELEKLQMETPNKTTLKLIQEVKTRWNSCYDMLERFLLLSGYITVVLMKLQRERSTRNKPPTMLNADELEILQEARDLLKPLWQVTVEMSSEKTVTLSKCIPLINAMKSKINGIVTRTVEGVNFRKKLLSLIEAKFSNVEFVRPYSAATLLDPRFKKEVFSNIIASSKAVTYIGSLVADFIGADSRVLVEQIQQAENSEKVVNSAESLWYEFDQSVKDKILNADQDVAGGIPVELRQYLNRPIISREDNPNPLAAWAVLKGEYPHVYKVALKFLPVLATSVPAERLFSHTGLIATKLRNRISGEHLDQLVFMRSLDAKWF